jgi:hypothetical protein
MLVSPGDFVTRCELATAIAMLWLAHRRNGCLVGALGVPREAFLAGRHLLTAPLRPLHDPGFWCVERSAVPLMRQHLLLRYHD